MFNTFFLLHRLIYTVLCQKDFEKPPSERTSNSDSGNIANIVICFYVLKFSKENCFTLPFHCTAQCAEHSTKEGFNNLLHREFLIKNQETLQTSVFSLILLKKMFPTFCLLHFPIYRAFRTTSFIEHV